MTTYTSRGVPMAQGTDSADIAARLNPVAQVVHDRPGVSALTTAQRNALAGAELWDGRVITNLTIDRLQRYDAGLGAWVTLQDELAGTPRIASGQLTTAVADGLSTITIPLPDGRFSTTPRCSVTAIVDDPNRMTGAPVIQGATSSTQLVFRVRFNAAYLAIPFDWIAIQSS